MNTNKKLIGVVGGIGPYAGIDLVKKILDLTKAKCDQGHLPISMLSIPHSIPDRSQFVLGKSNINPAIALSKVIYSLYKQGATVIGMPCNTAHSEPIFSEIKKIIPKQVKLIHMINEVSKYIKEVYPSAINIGILSTTGTAFSNVYPDNLSKFGFDSIQVSDNIQKSYIHPAIYSADYGIKAYSTPVSVQAKDNLLVGVEDLLSKKVDAIILGCTEIPLALTSNQIKGIPLIDATKVLARALILASSPDSLLEKI